MTSSPRVFVSHSHQDNAYCREFVAALRQKLASDDAVWYDEHNLGWGALRQTIDLELSQRQHFIAILSPAAITSDWVNTEIDAALALLRNGSMRTIQFVTAVPCNVPPTLQRYKRIEQAGGMGFPAVVAAGRALAVINTAPSADTPKTSAGVAQSAAPLPSSPPRSSLPPPRLSPAQSTKRSLFFTVSYVIVIACTTALAGIVIVGLVGGGLSRTLAVGLILSAFGIAFVFGALWWLDLTHPRK